MKVFNRLKNIFIICLICFMSMACSQEKFDAHSFAMSTLRFLTTGKTEELVAYGMDQKELDDIYEEMMTKEYAIFDDQAITDATRKKWEKIIDKAFELSLFDVSEAVKTEEGYEVEITIYPLLFTEIINSEEFEQEITENALKAIEENEIKTKDIDDYIYSEMADMISKRLDKADYGDPVKFTVTYVKDDGIYKMKDEKEVMEKIGDSMFD